MQAIKHGESVLLTCVVANTVDVPEVFSVFGEEAHSSVIGHGVRQVPCQASDVDGIIGGGTTQQELVFHPVSLVPGVNQLHMQNRVSLHGQAVDLSQAQPVLLCNTNGSLSASRLFIFVGRFLLMSIVYVFSLER